MEADGQVVHDRQHGRRPGQLHVHQPLQPLMIADFGGVAGGEEADGRGAGAAILGRPGPPVVAELLGQAQ